MKVMTSETMNALSGRQINSPSTEKSIALASAASDAG
jgi:hypothetical protein